MTLLITLIAAVVSTAVWYQSEKARIMHTGTLALMYWGASLMWLVDAAAEYAELRAEFFAPAAADMLNDTFLGLSVAVLGLVIWLVIVLVKDPLRTVRNLLQKHHG